jgi:transcriptional regulator with XRE-family HTH domain
MDIPIPSTTELGHLIRAVRRASGVRIDDLAATAGLSKQFVQDVEQGKPTARLGLVLKLLAELGLPLSLNIPQAATAELAEVKKRSQAKAQKTQTAQTSRVGKTPRMAQAPRLKKPARTK